MKNLTKLSTEQLLSLLPHRLQIRFALDCVNDVRHLLKDERSIKALEITELWLEGKATDLEVRDAAYAANASYALDSVAAYIAYDAAYTAYYAAHAVVRVGSATTYNAYSAGHVADVYNAIIYAAKAQDKFVSFYKPKLIQMIENMTEFEKILLNKP